MVLLGESEIATGLNEGVVLVNTLIAEDFVDCVEDSTRTLRLAADSGAEGSNRNGILLAKTVDSNVESLDNLDG
jgi:hypothetical protein